GPVGSLGRAAAGIAHRKDRDVILSDARLVAVEGQREGALHSRVEIEADDLVEDSRVGLTRVRASIQSRAIDGLAHDQVTAGVELRELYGRRECGRRERVDPAAARGRIDGIGLAYRRGETDDLEVAVQLGAPGGGAVDGDGEAGERRLGCAGA